ncbi:MAG: hypothetical protein J6S92_11050 [Oscillospiraceae bacterium]|nr:hypothetical protein [Oscillospiraceae bacterium]MBP0988803.1 hypothetical protein [Oscillospiraceae bacterium]
MGKLTDQQKAEIYQKWKDGQAPKALAAEYNVSDQSIYNLVNKMNAQTELEDVENGIPNTPLVPAEIEKEISAIAEEKSENADAWRLPIVVQDAVNRYIHDIEDEIEMRERRILELQEELDTYRKLYTELADFRKAYRAKVDAAEEKYEAD